MKIISNIRWSDSEKELFLNLIEAAHGRSKASRQKAAAKIEKNKIESESLFEKFIEDDEFIQIAEPIHYQIIEALKIDTISKNINGLSEILDFPNNKISAAVDRLLSLNLITIEDDYLVVNEYAIRTSEKNPSMALRKHHSLQMKSALNSINEQDINTRSLSSLTIAIPKDILPEIFEKIVEFRKEINQYVSNHENQNKTDVYCMTTQCFRLTKENQ